jgi:hypothetical protein
MPAGQLDFVNLSADLLPIGKDVGLAGIREIGNVRCVHELGLDSVVLEFASEAGLCKRGGEKCHL